MPLPPDFLVYKFLCCQNLLLKLLGLGKLCILTFLLSFYVVDHSGKQVAAKEYTTFDIVMDIGYFKV